MVQQEERASTSGDSMIEITADVVSAYVANNTLNSADLPKLVADVHAALQGLRAPVTQEPVVDLKPAVPIRKSVTADFIVCLEDGKKFKSLKRHLQTSYGMSPEQYREKWKLPSDYPMVAANYSAVRSGLAKSIGLGKKPIAAKTTKRRKAQESAP